MIARLSDKYTYQTFWSEEDGEYVSTVIEFPSLSWMDEDAAQSLSGLRAVVSEVIADMEQSGEPVPQPTIAFNKNHRLQVFPDGQQALVPGDVEYSGKVASAHGLFVVRG